MITKIGISGLLALGASGGLGVLRANRLSDEDKLILAKTYGMSPDSLFRTRNALRSAGGMTVGGIGGGIAGALASHAIGLKHPALMIGGSALGGLFGAYHGSNKYSKKGVEDARRILSYRYAE